MSAPAVPRPVELPPDTDLDRLLLQTGREHASRSGRRTRDALAAGPVGTHLPGRGVERAMDRLVTTLLAHRRLVLACWMLLVLVGGAFAAGLPGRIVAGGDASASSDSDVVARATAHSPLPSLFVAIQVPTDATPADQSAVTSAIADRIRTTAGVTAVTPMPDTAPARLEGARVTVLDVSTSGGTDGAVTAAHRLSGDLEAAAPRGVQVHLGGFGAYRNALAVASQHDVERVEWVGIAVALAALLLTFGFAWAAGPPLLIALSALVMGLGGIGIAALFLPLSDFVIAAGAMVGLALGVDYAVFLMQRVRELKRDGQSTDDAVRAAMRTTGTAVFWSGLTALFAESTLLLVDSRSIRSAAFGMMTVTLFAVVAALTVAPVLFSLLGNTLATGRRHGTVARSSRGWQRWARQVTGRAPAWLIAGATMMMLLAVPSVRLHSSVDVSGPSSLPTSSSVRQAYALAEQRYGAAMSPLVVLLPPGEQADVTRIVAAVSADPDVAAVATQNLAASRTAIVVTPKSDPYSAAARGLVERLRHGSLKSALTGARYRVGGETAASVDAAESMVAGLPKVLVALLIVIGLLLLFALRSVWAPLRAVLSVALSLGAGLGSLALLTTTRLGAHLIGAGHPQEIHPIVPITVVIVTVALSTDYEIMLTSRIAERYRATGDNKAAVVDGVAHTGAVITGAAAIMVAAFAGFAVADVSALKQLGVGVGLAVLINAGVVRCVSGPAAMSVMGRWTASRGQREVPSSSRLDVPDQPGHGDAETVQVELLGAAASERDLPHQELRDSGDATDQPVPVSRARQGYRVGRPARRRHRRTALRARGTIDRVDVAKRIGGCAGDRLGVNAGARAGSRRVPRPSAASSTRRDDIHHRGLSRRVGRRAAELIRTPAIASSA